MPTSQAKYIEVEAAVRYWEDAVVNGIEDIEGTLIPLREGELWKPVIRLLDGAVMDWPQGLEASIDYKVCDQGQYWLQNADGTRVVQWAGNYVPKAFLCPGHGGFGGNSISGDYITLTINGDGMIKNWKTPAVNPQEWRE